ncbi:MAG: hypothetical protein JNM76_06150 [Betaproteobacteria bacterium]|nr:hypothetical protein [Betaproteobacteria bacterium]
MLSGFLAGREDNSISARLKRSAEDIAGFLVAVEEAGHTNPGAGYSARVDFLAIMGKTDLTPARLIALGLDRDWLFAYLEAVGKDELAEASQGRRGRVRDALRQFADAVLEIAPDLPPVRLEFMRVMLRDRP